MKKTITTTITGIIKDIETFDSETVFYSSEDWTGSSSVEGYIFEPDEDIPSEIEGSLYFLEVPTIIEVIETWNEWTNGTKESLTEHVDAVIYYAKYDAYKPVLD